jgi:hypothetical protein
MVPSQNVSTMVVVTEIWSLKTSVMSVYVSTAASGITLASVVEDRMVRHNPISTTTRSRRKP